MNLTVVALIGAALVGAAIVRAIEKLRREALAVELENERARRERAEQDLGRVTHAAQKQVETIRALLAGSDLPPADELRLLLDGLAAGPPPAPGQPPGAAGAGPVPVVRPPGRVG